MAKQRLSKLQKWILDNTLKLAILPRDNVREYWDKYFSPKRTLIPWDEKDTKHYDWSVKTWEDGHKQDLYSAKSELRTTRSMEASISRSIKGLKEKKLIEKTRLGYSLTYKGFLKVNNSNHSQTVNFNNYLKRVSEPLEALSNLTKSIKEIRL